MMMRALPIAILLLLTSFAVAEDYTVVKTTDGSGSWKAFNSPSDIWVDESTGRAFIADPMNFAVQVFSKDLTEHITVLGGDPAAVIGPYGLSQPRGLTFTLEKLYVADPGSSGIKIFTTDYGAYDALVGQSQSSVYQFNSPMGVAVDADGNMYVSDTGNDRIQVYDDGLEYLYTIGQAGSIGDNMLNTPRGIFIKDDQIYIADSDNNRVKILHKNGTFIKTIGVGLGRITLDHPADVAVGLDNRIYVADMLNDRIVVFSQSGSPLATIDGNLSGMHLDDPTGVYVDSMDYVYIADTGNNRVLRLKPSAEVPSIALGASDEISIAELELVSFNSLLLSSKGIVNYTGGDGGASSYLDLAREMYTGKDYITAKESAELARAFIEESREILEDLLNSTIHEELMVVMVRIDLYDQNITAGDLGLSTAHLRSQVVGVNQSLKERSYGEAAASFASLVAEADGLEEEINVALEEAKTDREELAESLDWLLGATSTIKERASVYRQELNASVLDSQLANATYQLSRDMFTATKAYEVALGEYLALNESLEEIIVTILDANASIVYAEQIVAEVQDVDVSTALATIEEAKNLLYTSPALSQQLAMQAIEQVEDEQERIRLAKDTVLNGSLVLLLLVIGAAVLVWGVYKMRLKSRERKMQGPVEAPKSEKKVPAQAPKPKQAKAPQKTGKGKRKKA